MKRKHDLIKSTSEPLNTHGFKVSEVWIYEHSTFPGNSKAHVPDLAAKGKTPLTKEDITTLRETKGFSSPPAGLSSGSCWE